MTENILEFQHIEKSFGGIKALSDVSLEIRKGEVHAIVGENGAGKSTLIKMCAGAYTPDSGKIIINGEEFEKLTPRISEEKGIGVIYQEFNLVNEMSIAENVFLGHAIRNGILIDRKEMNRRTVEIFEQLNIKIDPDELVKNLSVGYQQMTEIAKAISMNVQLLIMDEPSAPLTSSEVERMFDIVRALKKHGVTIIYISHRLEEIFQLSDRITVMRDGHRIETRETRETIDAQLIQLMVGRELKNKFPPRKPGYTEEKLLELQHVSGNGLEDISFCVKKGEILGLAGLVGAGRTELSHLLFGLAPVKKGTIKFRGKNFVPGNPRQTIREGIALVPEDRKKHGVHVHLSIRENISMANLLAISKNTVVNQKKEDKIVEDYGKALGIKCASYEQQVKLLSGGNQQKVVLAKWLSTEPELIILDEPTRGIDVGAKYEIYKIMCSLIENGKTIIMISSEMEELIGMADRIVVLAEKHMAGELERSEFSQSRIMEFASREIQE
ncbi:MAG: sugar ABC transporter ATP-binding protein [Eubacteriales bacterium]|nr:sugar ABC transporter ATP-binding protein [Eubacteriales bacterium]